MNLNQITVPSIDPAKSVAFYQTLGLKLIVNALPEYARFECPDGISTLSVHRVDLLPQGEGPWIYFECEKLDEQVTQLQQKGIAFEELPDDKSWLWREARLKDPDNNQLILYYAGEMRKDPPWRVK